MKCFSSKQKCALQISAQWNLIAFCARTPSQWILELSIFIHRRCGVLVTQCALVPGYFEIFSAIHLVFGNKRPLYICIVGMVTGNGCTRYAESKREQSLNIFFRWNRCDAVRFVVWHSKVQGWTNSISNRLDSFKQI